MKSTFLNLVLIISITTFLVSCNKDDSDSTATKQQISCNVDGVSYSVTTGGTDVEEADAHIRNGTRFQLDATTSTKDFSINYDAISGTGTYNIVGIGGALNFAQWEDGDALYSSLSTAKSHLTFTITSIAGSASDNMRLIEGTFSGVLYNLLQTDSVVITNGQIDIL
jgi:hypothetical protein